MLGTLDQGTLVYADPITEKPGAGTKEVWEFHNTTADAHPIHMHLVDFQIINREDFSITTGDKTNSGRLDRRSRREQSGAIGQQSGARCARSREEGHGGRVSGSDHAGVGEFHSAGRVRLPLPHSLSHEDHEMMRRYEVQSVV